MLNFLSHLFDTNQKEINSLLPIVAEINKLESWAKKLKNEEFKEQTEKWRVKKPDLNEILPQAFAMVREASFRVNQQRPFDVQLMAGIVLHRGKIAEQKTGEGKTLTAVFPLYLNALTGKGTHLVTVNDYLARRDCGWMGGIFDLLGLTVSAIIQEKSFIYDSHFVDERAQDARLKHLKLCTRKEAYAADVTYGINSEFGFDYLRDNMAQRTEDLAQRGFHFAIVDEVDSVLIDEARTPHIISVPDTEPTQKYAQYAQVAEKLVAKLDYEVDEKLKTAHLTEHGVGKAEKAMGFINIYEQDFGGVHHLEAALKAKTLFQKDKDYVVRDGEVIIVDEFTGRLLQGRRFSEGIHQALEAKEGVKIQQESKTLATVSLQNYFRKYEKLAGMTGTAATESEEFHKIYKLEVVVIPTNQLMVREDFPDAVYKTQRAKYAAVVKEIEEMKAKGRPVLVGTTSIENNELLSQFLKHKKIPHELLNAKNHEREALIITNAGQKGAVTIATNMAGRGVDIQLGEGIAKLGGLHIIGTERHESRRIDNQLRGRAGRQGDSGSSRFFVALDDEIMRIFGGDQVSRLMTAFNMPEDVPLEHPMVSKAIEQAQIKVETFHFDSRKHLVEYDDVMNKQREIIYSRRQKALFSSSANSLRQEIIDKITDEIAGMVISSTPEYGEPDYEKIINEFCLILPLEGNSKQGLLTQLQKREIPVTDLLAKIVADVYNQREKDLGAEMMREVEKWINLTTVDNLWMEHLDAMEDLREGIGLRGYGQRDPLIEYKNEAFGSFEKLLVTIDSEIVHRFFHVQVGQGAPRVETPYMASLQQNAPQNADSKHIGRNDLCPCNSGKKYKKCCYPKYG